MLDLNSIDVHDAARAGFECMAEKSVRHLTNVMNQLESFALDIEEHDNSFLPPDMMEENLRELIDACKILIWRVMNLNTAHKFEILYIRETIQDDGIGSAYVEECLEKLKE